MEINIGLLIVSIIIIIGLALAFGGLVMAVWNLILPLLFANIPKLTYINATLLGILGLLDIVLFKRIIEK